MDSIKVHTIGCKVNSYDTGLIEERLSALDIQDLHILNTCAVTEEASKEALRRARRIKREYPNSKIVITGCSAQVDTELFQSVKEVDLIVANSHKSELAEIISHHYAEKNPSNSLSDDKDKNSMSNNHKVDKVSKKDPSILLKDSLGLSQLEDSSKIKPKPQSPIFDSSHAEFTKISNSKMSSDSFIDSSVDFKSNKQNNLRGQGQSLKNNIEKEYDFSLEDSTPVIKKVYKSNIFKKSDLGQGGGMDSSHTRSFLKIQDGCNSFCTFCVIPFARGKSRSLEIDEIVDRVHAIYDKGVREVVITGIHIGDYEDHFFGPSHKRGLEDLMEQLLIRTKMPRFRISSLEPLEITDRLLDLYKEEAMCPHFHMSLQSLNDKILKSMKRKNSSLEAENILNKIHKEIPNVFIGMDLIVGFPGESDENFLEVKDKLIHLPWTKLHVFPYSERPGTFATRLDQKNYRHTSVERSRLLRELSQNRYDNKIQTQVGTRKKIILLKSKSKDTIRGLSRDYWSLTLASNDSKKIDFEYEVLVKSIDKNKLIGEWV